MRKSDIKVKGRERKQKTHSRSPSTLSPRGCRAFQSTRLHNIHSSNQFYQRNQYGWNIGLLWLVTFSWGLCEQGNVFTMIRLKQPGHWEGWSSDAAIIIIIITKTPFLWLTFGPSFQRVWFCLVAARFTQWFSKSEVKNQSRCVLTLCPGCPYFVFYHTF